jgi:ATP-binding cassette subfamily B protein
MASFSRIKDLLLKKTDIPDEGNIVLNGFYHLRVKNLSFQYADASSPILKNINFEINKGEKVGIVGPVGSGKTTLLHVLNRLFPVDPGMIEMNGHSIEQITQKSLHQTIAFVPQEPFLFSDSISDNIQMALDEPVLDDELLHWTDAVDLKSEIMSLPQAFVAQLGERGVNLSGGQKQRLTIARGLITKAPLIVLDDSLSAVDHKTEATIQNQLKNQLEKKTQIIVTHRLSAIRDADKIIVLKDGEIEAIGTHDELILKSSAYKQIADIQGGQHE